MIAFGNSGASTGGNGSVTKAPDPIGPYVRPGGLTVTVR